MTRTNKSKDGIIGPKPKAMPKQVPVPKAKKKAKKKARNFQPVMKAKKTK